MCNDGAADNGSLYQLRNILGRTNVGKDPTKDFNAYEDFFLEVISGHIIAAFAYIKVCYNLKGQNAREYFSPAKINM